MNDPQKPQEHQNREDILTDLGPVSEETKGALIGAPEAGRFPFVLFPQS